MPRKINVAKNGIGLEVGRLILKDQARAYESLAQGGDGRGLLSDRERLELVDSLKEPEDIRQFNQFRYLHEYLTRAGLTRAVHRQTASACFWRLNHLVGLLEQPAGLRLMTGKQYRDYLDHPRPLFCARAEPPEGPMAILTAEAEAGLAAFIDERGYFREPPGFPVARPSLDHIWRSLPQAIDEYRQALKEQLVIETAVDLISCFVKVPEIKAIVGTVDVAELSALNNLLLRAAQLAPAAGPALTDLLVATLRPFRLEELAPTEAARRTARRMVGFATVQGNIEPFYQLLRRSDA